MFRFFTRPGGNTRPSGNTRPGGITRPGGNTRPNGITRAGFLAGLFVFLLGTAFEGSAALPPFIPLAQRVKESDVVVVGDISRVRSRHLNAASRAGSIRINVLKTLKGEKPPKTFSVSFLVFPNSWEDRLRKAPPPGRYFIFLKKKMVEDKQGRLGEVLVLYRPHPFSYEPYNKETIKEMNSLLNREVQVK